MKILNSSRFYVEIGDRISYNYKAVDYINRYRKSKNFQLWPSANKLNSKNPIVVGYCVTKCDIEDNGIKTFIEVRVTHDDGFTGLSDMVNYSENSDIWFLEPNGSLDKDFCPYPLFLKEK